MNQIACIAFGLLLCVTTQIDADELTPQETQLRNHADAFMTQGWGGEAIRGYEAARDVKGFFHRIGKVLNESVRLIPHDDNPSVNDESDMFQYDGMTVLVYLARFEHGESVKVVDAVITSPKWPVKQGLGIGTTRKQIEALFGKSMETNSDREWTYGDGPEDITYTFDKNDKAISIHWHALLD